MTYRLEIANHPRRYCFVTVTGAGELRKEVAKFAARRSIDYRMTAKQRQLINYIEGHGHQAYALAGRAAILAISRDQHGRKHWDLLAPTWRAVHGWLGY